MVRRIGILVGRTGILVVGLLLLTPALWSAQREGFDADAPVPPGAKFQILDLKFRTESTGGVVQKLAVKETPTEVRIELPADVLFDFDKSDIRPDAADALHQVADILRRYPKGRATIEGHTDSKGSDDYNQRLSERRAQSVRQWLQGRENVTGIALETKGWGAKKPVAPNTKPDGSDDPEGRQKNRRVEIIVAKTAR